MLHLSLSTLSGEVQFVELSKLNELLKKPVGEMTDLEKWAVFLRYAESPDYREIVNRVLETKEGLNVAGELLMGISQDERERAIFRSRRMYQSDLESNMYTARREGKAEGLAEGREQVVRNLLAEGLPIETIARAAELSAEQIRAIAERLSM